ncbi:hypothetical protein QCA50_009643 [Cerrena zonata]|uniref:AB hydrolase-1 domain-containing protein n=1 Tax=Cerrena zonata TaxID=2478898 RepID=A0AAW0G7M1_9APHY
MMEKHTKPYYKIYGDLNVANRTRTPLVVLHGGPGLSHDYLLPIANLSTISETPVIFYDQIGNARSTHLKDKPNSFWTIDLWVDELTNLLNHFGITDSFDLLGHSWGGILGSEYEVRKQPPGLRHLILSNSLAAYNLWVESNEQLIGTLSEEAQKALEDGREKDREKFRAGLFELHSRYGCLVQPFPKEYVYSMDQIFGPEGDTTVNEASESIVKDWSVIDRLHSVRVPTLVINGRLDISQDFVVKPFFDGIRRIKWITMENSSHTPFFEEPERYLKLVADFLRQ